MPRSIRRSRHPPPDMGTNDPDPTFDFEAEGAWLHRLARSMCRDRELAADAAQITLTTALEKAPAAPAERRPWLVRVLRNRLNQEWRSASRRLVREQRSAAKESAPAPDETLARIEFQETVAAALRTLEEPYRTAVVLRFLDGLPPRAIATRTGAPVRTVKSRIERGLARLRVQLDRTARGGREGWLRAFLLLPTPTWTAQILTGVSVMGTGTKITSGAAAALVLAVGATRMFGGEARSEQVEALVAEAGVLVEGTPVVDGPENETTTEREAFAQPTEAATPLPTYSGLVVDSGLAPLAGVKVALRLERSTSPASAPVTSDPAGRISLVPDKALVGTAYNRPALVSVDPEWVALQSPIVEPDGAAGRMVVAPAREVTGYVVDDTGAPLAGVDLELAPPLGLLRALDTGAATQNSPRWSVKSDPEGRFHFAVTPRLEGTTLGASRGGYEPCEQELGLGDTRDLRLVLPRLAPGESVVSGRVFGPDGAPFGGAWVSCGGDAMRSEANGWFAVRTPDPENGFLKRFPLTVRALAAGHLPDEVALDPSASEHPFLELRLGREPLTVSGTVTGMHPDHATRHTGMVAVWVNGIAPFGTVQVDFGAGRTYDRFSFVEELLVEDDRPAGMAYVEPDGTFEIQGLRDQEYELYAYDSLNLALVGPVVVQAGSHGHELMLAPDIPPASITGRVVDRRGNPVPGILVSASRNLPIDGFTSPSGSSVTTDDQGFFVLSDLSFDSLDLHVIDRGEGKASDGYFRFEAGELLDPLELVVGRPLRIRIVTDDPTLFEAKVMFLDSEGDGMSIEQVDGTSTRMSGEMSLAAGNSGILVVDDRAETLYVKVPNGDRLRFPIEIEGSDEVFEIRIP